MAITNGYATAAELKTRLGISDATDDSPIEAVIEAASRAIDAHCRRRFYAANETRYYTAEDHDIVFVDDVLSVSALATDSGNRTYATTWATTDYDLEPHNATLNGQPYTMICTTPQGSYHFTAHKKGVKVTGSFGYSATTPDLVNEACLIQAARLFKRKDAPFGIAGVGDLGEIRLTSALDPDVKMMLASLVKPLIA